MTTNFCKNQNKKIKMQIIRPFFAHFATYNLKDSPIAGAAFYVPIIN